MKNQQVSLPQRLQLTKQRLSRLRQILRPNLRQLPTQTPELSAIIEQLSLLQSEFESIVSTLTQTSDELSSVLCHEFFTPLTLIQGSLQLLAAGKLEAGSEEALVLLKLAFKQTNQLICLVRELLLYQELKSGQFRIFPQPYPAAELVRQAAQAIPSQGKQLEVIHSVKPAEVRVWAAPNYTILLLSHLISNAIKFSPTPTIVTLKATLINSASQLVLFQVKDRGIGIPPQQLKKIFDCFYQVNRSDSRPYNGLGLGLALAHQIIQQQGGQLWAESSLGVGSTFYFTLPAYPPVKSWWLEIQTTNPQCTYYFGPFETFLEASSLQAGYLEDLRQEQAQVITAKIKQCQPQQLTICEQSSPSISRELD